MNATQQRNAEGYCAGCGTSFSGRRGLRAHQSAPHQAMACRYSPAPEAAAASEHQTTTPTPTPRGATMATTETPTTYPAGTPVESIRHFDRSTKVAFHCRHHPSPVWASKEPAVSRWFGEGQPCACPLSQYVTAREYTNAPPQPFTPREPVRVSIPMTASDLVAGDTFTMADGDTPDWEYTIGAIHWGGGGSSHEFKVVDQSTRDTRHFRVLHLSPGHEVTVVIRGDAYAPGQRNEKLGLQ